MRKIQLFFMTVLIATMVIGEIPTNMIQNITNVQAETKGKYMYGVEGEYSYEIVNDGTIKIINYNRIVLPDTVSPDWARVPSKIAGKEVTCIGSGAFKDCHSVTSIDIPDSVTTIESYAFEGTWAIVEIPSAIKTIGSWAFSGCGGVSVRGSVSLPNKITLPKGVTKIEEGVFSNCTWLEGVVIPNSVKSIDNQAFEGCTNLRSIIIPNTVMSIGDKAFYNCKELKSIKIPVNTTVGRDAFVGCEKLKIEYETGKVLKDTTTFSVTKEEPTTKITKPKNVFIGKTKVKRVTKKFSSNKAKISLKKINGAKYQIKISTAKSFKKKKTIIKKVTKATFTIKHKKIQKKKTLYVKARAYKIINGKTYYGKWSEVKRIKIKK